MSLKDGKLKKEQKMKSACTIGPAVGIKTMLIVGMCWATLALAEGTREIISDRSLYAGEPMDLRCVDLYQWSYYGSGHVKVDSNFEGISGIPEGVKVLRVESTNRWGGCGVFFLNCNDLTVTDYDFSSYAGGHLRFFLKSTNQLAVEIEFVTSLGQITKAITNVASTSNLWQEIVVPLSSLRPAINFSRIRGPFLITTQDTLGRKAFFVDHVRWTKPVDHLEIYPSHALVYPGKQMQFSAIGKTSAGETILLYSTFSGSSGVGTVDPAAPALTMSSILTGGGSTGIVIATAIGATQPLSLLSVTSTVDIAVERVDQQLGLLTETVFPMIALDTDSKLFVFTNDVTSNPVLAPTIDTKMEGNESLLTTVNHTNSNNYSGWTIQWGQAGTTDDDTRDMSLFYDDFVRFWFRGERQLEGKITIGIRSGNVFPGHELSYVSLTNYSVCDNQWHAVAIPLRVFAKSRPWADLARTKNLFTIAVTGNTGGPATFFIDNLRWGTVRPRLTALASASGAKLSIESNPGVLHVLERSTDLLYWTVISTNVPSTPVFQLLDSSAVTEGSLFYRLRIE